MSWYVRIQPELSGLALAEQLSRWVLIMWLQPGSSAAVSDGPRRGWADASQPTQTEPHSPVLVAMTQLPEELIPSSI